MNLKRRVRLGEMEKCETPSDKYTFSVNQFTRINKIASLNNNMFIYPPNKTTPICFKSYIGSVGEISVYVKSKELIESEMYDSNSDSDSDDYD